MADPMSYKEISDFLGITTGDVRIIESSALEKVRAIIYRRGFLSLDELTEGGRCLPNEMRLIA